MSKKLMIGMVAMVLVGTGAGFAANTLDVNNTAAMGPDNGSTTCSGGNCGLEVIFDGSVNAAKVVDTTPTDEGPYRAQFWVDFSNLSMNDSTFFVFARATDVDLFRSGLQLLVTRKFNIFRLSGRAGTNSPSVFRITPRLNIPDTCQNLLLQVEREQSPAPATPGGELTITVLDSTGSGCPANDSFVNTTQFHGVGINNSSIGIDDFHWGAVGNIAAGMTGSMYLDEFSSFRTLAAP